MRLFFSIRQRTATMRRWRSEKPYQPINLFHHQSQRYFGQTTFEKLQTYLIRAVNPIVEHLDNNPEMLKQVIAQLAKDGWLGATIPTSLGGLGLSPSEYHQFKKTLARHSGALAFLQTQHQTAAQLIDSSKQDGIKAKYLVDMAKGKRLMGMALSPHLAYWQNPMVTAVVKDDGFLITKAHIKMATGYQFFDDLLLGFVAKHDGQPIAEVTALIPFQNSHQDGGGTLRYSAPLKLLAAQSTNTVSLEIHDWYIPYESVVKKEPLGSFAQKSLTYTNLDSYLAGVMEALLEIAVKQLALTSTPASLAGYNAFCHQLAAYEQMVLAKTKDTPVAQLRAAGIELCDACFAFLRQLLRGRVLLKDDSVSQHLHRLERERDLYSVVTAYQDLLEATLQQQTHPHAVLSAVTPSPNLPTFRLN